MFLHILTEPVGNLPVINVNRHSRLTFGQLDQYGIINIIVYNHYSGLRLTDKISYQYVSIKNLPVEKNSFLGLQGGTHEEIHLIIKLE